MPSDYVRIEAAIRFLEANARAQPGLEEVARAVGLSQFHLQRLFTRWAGISPKRFLSLLTLQHARSLLAERQSLLDASLSVGLSGPGRLHDLFVSMTALTPGEYARGGAGLRIRYGVHPSPFGRAVVASCDRGLCALSFLAEDEDPEAAVSELRGSWPGAEVVEAPRATSRLAASIFSSPGAKGESQLSLFVRGTALQVRVWEALLRIPAGAVVSYREVARAAGADGAVRAVASAIGQNPIAYLIPCHRVLRTTGALGGYRWGLPRKRALLAWEAARTLGEAPEAGVSIAARSTTRVRAKATPTAGGPELPATLVEAYRHTRYQVYERPPAKGLLFELRVGRREPALEALFAGPGRSRSGRAARGRGEWAFLTAHNPGLSHPSDEENRRAQARLEARLTTLGYDTWPAAGVARGGDHREPSVFVRDIPREVADALGREFHQAAILTGRVEGPAELVFL